jgi:hypothetical protein
MPQENIGPFVVNGPQDQIDLVKKALDHLDHGVSMDHFIRGQFTVMFHPVGNVPGTNSPAYGFFHGGARRLEIRNGMGPAARNLRPPEVIYTFLHEAFGHGGERDGVLNIAKRREILNHMHVPIKNDDVMGAWRRGATPPGQQVRYWSRPYEAYCDLLVAAISDGPALFERKYLWDIDPDVLKEIVLRDSAPDPEPHEPHPHEPDDPPNPGDDPDPVPPDLPKGQDECAEFRDQVSVQQQQLSAQQTQISSQETQIATQQTQLATQQTQLGDQATQISSLQSQIASMEAALNTARRDVT